jgi:SAM-dependent methyltransferase
MKREFIGELMDDPGCDHGELTETLHLLRIVNRRLGGTAASLRHFQKWRRRWPAKRDITVLDLGCGSADLAVAFVNWGVTHGHRIHVTAVDRHPKTMAGAHEYVNESFASGFCRGDRSQIVLCEDNALKLMDRFSPRSVDYVHASLFLHHLPTIEVRTMLRIMDRIARAGIIWNDLIRGRLQRWLVELLVIGRSPMLKHDARASVRAGFSRRDVESHARSVDIDYATFRRWALPYRFTFAGEKPGAWAGD